MPKTMRTKAMAGWLLLCAAAVSAAATERLDDAPSPGDISAILAGARLAPGVAVPQAVAPPAAPEFKPGDKFSGLVTRVVDADTLWVSHARQGPLPVQRGGP